MKNFKSIVAALLLVCGLMFASGKDENTVQSVIALLCLLSAAMIFAALSVEEEKKPLSRPLSNSPRGEEEPVGDKEIAISNLSKAA